MHVYVCAHVSHSSVSFYLSTKQLLGDCGIVVPLQAALEACGLRGI